MPDYKTVLSKNFVQVFSVHIKLLVCCDSYVNSLFYADKFIIWIQQYARSDWLLRGALFSCDIRPGITS